MALEVRVAEHAGACYGVQRALHIAREASAGVQPVHTLGPLIHNPRVVAGLEKAGVFVAASLDEAGSGTLVLRSHGTAPSVVAEAEARGFAVVDATCPYVSKVQRQARRLANEGYAVVIVGEPGHAEVEGIRAWGGDAVCAVADDPSALPEDLPGRVGVVVQTTQSAERVEAVVAALRERVAELHVEQTVCLATAERQQAAAELAARSDVVVVVGGRNSGNTTRLAEVARRSCLAVHHIEGAEELDPAWFSGATRVGVTAGASTPGEQIEAVVAHLRSL